MASTADLVTDDAVEDSSKDEKRTFLRLNFTEKISYVREVITVEPFIGAYVMASILCYPALVTLEFEKSCRVNLKFEDAACEAILDGRHQNYTKENNEIILLISNMHSWQLPIQSVMPLILVLFLGTYSDRHQWRKPFLILPICGEFLAVAGCILCVAFMDSWPLEAQGVFQTVVPSFFGGQTMIVMAVFAYIADVSTLEMRTLRIGVVQIVLNTITPLTQLFAAHLFNLIGYYGVLLVAAGLYAFALLYTIFWIKEPRQKVSSDMNVCYDIFNPTHAIETFNLALKKTPGNNRLYIWMVLLTLLIYNVVVVGEASIFYFYTESQFHWTLVEFGYFLTVNTVLHLVGTAVAVPLFTKVLSLSDLSILLLTFLDKIICNIVFVFANTDTLLYAGAVVSIITGVTTIGMRSLATKIVSENDLGKAQSLFGICEAVAQAIAAPIYNKGLLNNTYDTFPVAFLVFGVILYGLCCAVFGWMFVRDKVKDRKQNSEGIVNGADKNGIRMESYVETTRI